MSRGSADEELPSEEPTVIGAMSIEDAELEDAAFVDVISPKRVATAKRQARRAVWLTGRLMGVGSLVVVFVLAIVDWPARLIDQEVSRERIMSSLFAISLLVVALEDVLGVNKSAVVLCLAATMWTVLAVSYHDTYKKEGEVKLHEEASKALQEVGEILLFLLPAMGVVESIDHFNGFAPITKAIHSYVGDRRTCLVPIICLVSFGLSSVIDNLTSTIVALKILRHLVPEEEQRHLCGSLVVLAANAGGAWSPIGDVTTTMLWMSKKITVKRMVVSLFPSSFAAGFAPLLGMWWQMRRQTRDVDIRMSSSKPGRAEADPLSQDSENEDAAEPVSLWRQLWPMLLGIGLIVMVPALKMGTGLPPYLGMLLALGAYWIATDFAGIAPRKLDPWDANQADSDEDSSRGGAPEEGVVTALKSLDLTGLLFFSGILLAIGALKCAGVLTSYSHWLGRHIGDKPIVLASVLGVSSAVVDNVPLVEAAIGMFNETAADEPLWHLTALTAGTGGSILSIGSVAGVTLMTMEGVGFLWYVQKVSFWAFFGFAAGIATYKVQHAVLGGALTGD